MACPALVGLCTILVLALLNSPGGWAPKAFQLRPVDGQAPHLSWGATELLGNHSEPAAEQRLSLPVETNAPSSLGERGVEGHSLSSGESVVGDNARDASCLSMTRSTMPRMEAVQVFQSVYARTRCAEAAREATSLTGIGREKEGCNFFDFGRALLRHSRERNKSFVTVQIGGMDGKSNDPMYTMFAGQGSLKHWVPIIFEPVADNFARLKETYQDLKRGTGLECALLSERAIAYDRESPCTFCHFNTSGNALEECRKHPDWMKFQLGTLQCEWSKKFYEANFERCIVKANVECGTIQRALSSWGVAHDAVLVLQIDVEGYETHILGGMLSSLPRLLPPIIHFEWKVMRERDQKSSGKKPELAKAVELLRNVGYELFQSGEDVLAVLVSEPAAEQHLSLPVETWKHMETNAPSLSGERGVEGHGLFSGESIVVDNAREAHRQGSSGGINAVEEEERCRSYGFGYDKNRTVRRIFAGSLIAEDEWAPIEAVAAEMRGLIHAYAFVESNVTQAMFPRRLRFASGSDELRRLQGLYGAETAVTVDVFYPVELKGVQSMFGVELLRENDQRELILQRWKASGMRQDDIGLLTDTDETFTRDFLRATQTCDVPEFRRGQDCLRSKIVANALVFESSPDCIVQSNTWHHPDMLIGECVDQIGDEEVHRPGRREPHPLGPRHGARLEGYGTNGFSKMPNTTMYPLLNAWDYRLHDGGRQVRMVEGVWKLQAARLQGTGQSGQLTGYTAYHFHNFFRSIAAIRHKYHTYGHPMADALTKNVGELGADVNLTVNCVLNRSDDGSSRRRLAGGLSALVGPKPLYFTDEYRAKRGEELRAMFETNAPSSSGERGVD